MTKLNNELTANGVTYDGQDFLARLSATDPQGMPVTYTLVEQPGNYLPRDFFLDPLTGVISGKASLRNFANTRTSLVSHTWPFFIRASNDVNYTDQGYEIEIMRINSPPVWVNAVAVVNTVDQSALTGWFLIGPPLPYGHWDGAQTDVITSATDYMSVSNGSIIFTSKPSDAPFVTTDSSFIPEIGKTYKVTYSVKKITQETNSIKSYLKPAFDATYANGTLDPALGTRSGNGYSSITDSIDTTDWVIGQSYEVNATWSPSNQYAIARGRIRVNRSEPDSRLGTNPYSDAVFEINGQNIEYVSNSTPIVILTNSSPTNLGNYKENSKVLLTFNAISPQELSLIYSVSNGTLPSGFTLDSKGYLNGTVDNNIPRGNTISNFTLLASDGLLSSTHDFSFTSVYVNNAPLWNSPTSFTANGAQTINFTVSATQLDNYPITYTLVNRNNLPAEIVVNNNMISGTIPNITNNTVYTFTMRANDGVVNVDKLITINAKIKSSPPIWVTPTGSIGSFTERTPLNNGTGFQFLATDVNNDTLDFTITSGKLPNGLNLSKSGKLSGTPVNAVDQSALTGWFLIGPPLPYGHWDGAQTNVITAATDYMSIDSNNKIIFTSKPSDAPFVTTDSSFTPEVGKTYKITYSVKKITQETNGIKSYMKPAFDATYANGTLDPALGIRSGEGYNSTTDSVDTTSWVIGQPYDISVTWSPTNQYASARGRIRVNRSEPDSRLGTNPYSNAVFEISGQNIEYVNPVITYNFTISLSDSAFSVPRDFSLIIGPSDGPPINTTVAWNNPSDIGVLSGGSQYNFTPNLTITGQVGDTFYELKSGSLPNGTSLNSTTGIISGTLVNTPSTVSFTIRATNNSVFSERTFTGSVIGGTTILWNSPNAGDIGAFSSGELFVFTPSVTVSNPVGSTVFSVINGAIPSGTTLNTTTGEITGTLTGSAAQYSFTLRATNNGVFLDRTFVTWVDTISLTNFDTIDITNYPGTSGYQIVNGKVRVNNSYDFFDYGTDGVIAHDISKYEVYAERISGTPTSGAYNTWINLVNSPSWEVVGRDFAISSFAFNLSIRKVGTVKVLDVINVTLWVGRGLDFGGPIR